MTRASLVMGLLIYSLLLVSTFSSAGLLLSSSEEECLEFLYGHMPEEDRGLLGHEFLTTNVQYALKARELTSWGASSVPWNLFLNNVLPYAVLNERRDDWRPFFYDSLSPLVLGTAGIEQAASVINARIWNLWNLAFVGGQTPQTMSPFQVLSAGNASCTGMSILMVDALRSVGLPARIVGSEIEHREVGDHSKWPTSFLRKAWDTSWLLNPAESFSAGDLIRDNFTLKENIESSLFELTYYGSFSKRIDFFNPVWLGMYLNCSASWMSFSVPYAENSVSTDRTAEWNDGSGGNHDWVEVWYDQGWHFIDAFDGTKFDEGWFVPSPVKYQRPNSGIHSIYASSFQPTAGDVRFPLAWDFEDLSVPGLDVTQWYLDFIVHTEADRENLNSHEAVAGNLVQSLLKDLCFLSGIPHACSSSVRIEDR